MSSLTPFPSTSTSTSSPTPQAPPLPLKRGEIGYRSASLRRNERERLDSSTSNSTSTIAIGQDREGRLDSRLSTDSRRSGTYGTVNSSSNQSQPTNPTSSTSPPSSSSSSTTTSNSSASLTSRLRNFRFLTPFPTTWSRNQSSNENAPPLTRRQRVTKPLVWWLFTIATIIGSSFGYSIALRDNARSQAMAQAYDQLTNNSTSSNSTISDTNSSNSNFTSFDGNNTSDDSDVQASSNASLFLNSLFILFFIFLATIFYKTTRALYIALFFSYTPSDSDPNSQPPAKKKNPVVRILKRGVEWFLRIPQEKLQPKEEQLPSYINALGIPAAGREYMQSLSREERRLRRIGSTRGTGDAEDIEVERSWRMGGGAPLPVYQGVEFRSSRVLLTGPPIENQTNEENGSSEGLGGMVERLSRRLSQTAQEVMRRFSYFGGSGTTTPTTAGRSDRTIDISIGGDNERPSSLTVQISDDKLKAPPSPGISPSTPVRLAYHASVILDTAAIEEEKSLEKEEGSDSKGKGRIEHKVESNGSGEYRRKSWWQLPGSGFGSSSSSSRTRTISSSSNPNSDLTIPNTVNPIKRFSQISIPINSSSIIVEIPEEGSEEGLQTVESSGMSTSTATLNMMNSPKSAGNFGNQQQQNHRRRTSSTVVLEIVKEENEGK